MDITPNSYAVRVKQAEDDFDSAGGEGRYRPPERTPAEVAERTITIEEQIAIELLKTDVHFGIYTIVNDYVKRVISDKNYIEHMSPELRKFHSDACDGRIGETEYDRSSADVSLAKLILADSVIRHRLTGYSGSMSTACLGFGLAITTSLAANIVEYHKRVLHAR
jgi:hypothetical protein